MRMLGIFLLLFKQIRELIHIFMQYRKTKSEAGFDLRDEEAQNMRKLSKKVIFIFVPTTCTSQFCSSGRKHFQFVDS